MTTEARQFKMHPKLLFDVIQRQAGTLSKAILEGVMNAVDAGSTEVTVDLTENQLVITDDGKGFRSKEEIELFFETFGQPHAESEGKIYGTFRMGRGQLFSFGRNDWVSGKFHMDVDIKERGLDYTLSHRPKARQGCSISVALYNPLLPSGLFEVQSDIEKWCKWAPIPVLFNGKQVNPVKPEDAKWDFVTDEAYISLKATQGPLSVYNLGIHVTDLPSYRFGTAGELVSRKQLRVNFARNDIQSDCPHWKKITAIVNQEATETITKKKTLNDSERMRLARQFVTGQISYREASKMSLMTLCTGRNVSINDFLNSCYKYSCFSVTNKGSRLGDMLIKTQLAYVLADETLIRFGVPDGPALVSTLARMAKEATRYTPSNLPQYKPIEELNKGFKQDHEIIDEKQYTDNEKLWLALVSYAGLHSKQVGDAGLVYRYNGRKVVIGKSDKADGWTDGETYVAINREFLKTLDFDVAGIVSLGQLLLHEACHADCNHDDHDHDQAFFENYHDNHKWLARFVNNAFNHLPAALTRLNRRVSKKMLKIADKVHEIKTKKQVLAARQT
jgi:hypothetical protein